MTPTTHFVVAAFWRVDSLYRTRRTSLIVNNGSVTTRITNNYRSRPIYVVQGRLPDVNTSITVFQLGWEKGSVQKKLGTI